MLANRDFTEEEVSSSTWNCRLWSSPRVLLGQLMLRLPEANIAAAVEEYRNRGAAIQPAAAKRPRFILKRAMKNDQKKEATEHFLDWTAATFDTDVVDTIKRSRTGLIPYGVFGSYVRAHPPLARTCGMTLTASMSHNSKDYSRILKMYNASVRVYLEQPAAVAEPQPDSAVVKPRPDSAVVMEWKPTDNPYAKFRYKRKR